MRARAVHLVWVCGCALLLACGARQRPSAPASGTSLRYEVALAPDLGSMRVKLCFAGAMFGALIPGRAEAAARVREFTWLSGAKGTRTLDEGRIPIARDQRAGCLRYRVDLHEGGSLGALVTRVGEHLVASPNVWLWRPALRPLKLEATLALALPAGLNASLPFVPGDARGDRHEFQLPDSVFAFDSHAAFGRFQEIETARDGVRAHAALLGEVTGLDRAAAERWLREALRIAAQSDGRFPAAALHVLAIPSGPAGEPFGSIARGGGASVLMFVPSNYDGERLAHDWVLPHELSHLLLPFVRSEDAWFAEGLATYYQEVARARAGVISAEEALANIAQALRSAQHEGTGRSLCEESRAMHQTHAYRAVYWGGAAAFLQADLALRQESRGTLTLDALLTQIRREARMAPAYSATELLARMDELAHSQLFRALGARCEARPFPEFEPALQALGVDAQGRVLEDGAALRAAIFAPRDVPPP